MEALTHRAYFIISEGDNFLSKLIRWYQYGNTFTHSSVVIDIEQRPIYNPLVVSAVEKVKTGQFLQIHSKFTKQKRWKYYFVRCTRDQYYAYHKFAYRAVEKEYDVKGLLSFILRRDLNNPKKYFCSELVYECLWRAGIELLQDTASYEITTAILIKSPKVVEDKNLNKILWEYYKWK